jgi:hypothetical protein
MQKNKENETDELKKAREDVIKDWASIGVEAREDLIKDWASIGVNVNPDSGNITFLSSLGIFMLAYSRGIEIKDLLKYQEIFLQIRRGIDSYTTEDFAIFKKVESKLLPKEEKLERTHSKPRRPANKKSRISPSRRNRPTAK